MAISESTEQDWVDRVRAVLPDKSEEHVRKELRAAGNIEAAINKLLDSDAFVGAISPDCNNTSITNGKVAVTSRSSKLAAWGSLRPATAADMVGPPSKRRRKDQPPPFSHLVVLDFEWTADDRRPPKPISEITQFPSVLVQLDGRRSAVVSEFDTFVRPAFNPILTNFSKKLTAITQVDIDGAPILEVVLPRYMDWLRAHGLVDAKDEPLGHWAIATWSDADLGNQLAKELKHKGLAIPTIFRKWVNLKVAYQQHFRSEPKGGLQACVERLGLKFVGRAHNGLVDSRNTAKIVIHMARGSTLYPAFVFRRTTRGLDARGHPFGSKASREAYERSIRLTPDNEKTR